MKMLVKMFATAVAILGLLNAEAKNCGLQKKIFSKENAVNLSPGYLKVTIIKLADDDSLNLLKENYPAVCKNLIREFGNVENIKYSVRKKVLFLSFSSNGHKVVAVYSLNGNSSYSISNVGAALPKMITAKLKNKYPGYSVFYGKDLRINNETIYQVIIENNSEYRVINLQDEEMQEIKQIKKSI